MSRRKLIRVKDFDKAKARLSSMKSIDDILDLGNGLNLEIFSKSIETVQISEYNKLLSKVDEYYNIIDSNIDNMNDLSERMLTGIASKFGKNSNEYEMAGGVKKTDRKKAKPTNPSA